MKKIRLSLVALVAFSNMVYAGGGVERVVEPAIVIPQIEEDVETSVDGFYLGVGASAVSTRESDLDFFSVEEGQDRTYDVSLFAGYDFNEYIAIEGRYMFSVQDEDIIGRTSWGIYAKPQYYFTEDFKVYGLLGYGGFEINGRNKQHQKIAADSTGFQWGLGASYEVYENISIFIDYLNIARDVYTPTFVKSNVNVDSDAITIGISYHF